MFQTQMDNEYEEALGTQPTSAHAPDETSLGLRTPLPSANIQGREPTSQTLKGGAPPPKCPTINTGSWAPLQERDQEFVGMAPPMGQLHSSRHLG